MVPLSGARLERYLQNGAVIRWLGYNATCKMVPLSGWLALHIGPLSKIEKKLFFSYDIYGFAINRIYKKDYIMYISVFQSESRSSRNYFSLRVIAGKKTVRNAVNHGIIAASFVAAKKCFSRCFA